MSVRSVLSSPSSSPLPLPLPLFSPCVHLSFVSSFYSSTYSLLRLLSFLLYIRLPPCGCFTRPSRPVDLPIGYEAAATTTLKPGGCTLSVVPPRGSRFPLFNHPWDTKDWPLSGDNLWSWPPISRLVASPYSGLFSSRGSPRALRALSRPTLACC